MKQQLIVFGEDWGGLPSSTQHIIKQMSGQYAVTWINSLGLRTPKISWHDAKRIFNKAGRLCRQRFKPAAKQTVEVIKVVEPHYLPFLDSALARWVNRILLYRLLKRLAKPATQTNRPIIWMSLPNAVDALYFLRKTGLVNAVVVYYCCDDFSALEGVDHHAVCAFENELVNRAGLIVATSDALMEKFPRSKTHLVPHGVDIRLFCHQQSQRADDLPHGKPIAGFYGSIAGWIDIALLYELAQLMPDWNFVLIGPLKVNVASLNKLNNVYFLGDKSHEALPGYVQHWQVSLLPFKLNDQIIACNSLKLREYMAAGKPIVSVDFPQVSQYSRYVEVANDAQGFAAAIAKSLNEPPETVDLRQQQVVDESWQCVAGKIDRLIQRAV
jgi:glycosyltransferase involved in cell wall biosynthesis